MPWIAKLVNRRYLDASDMGMEFTIPPTRFDEEYVVEYDPSVLDESNQLKFKLLTTKDKARARRFPDPGTLNAYVRQTNGKQVYGAFPATPLLSFFDVSIERQP